MLLSLLQQKRDNETKVSPRVILALFLTVILYHICEGHITWLIVHKPHPEYTNWKGFCNAFYCSFYKTATLGSGSGIAGIYYLNKSGIPVPNATGMYFFQYIVHKVSMAVYSLLLFTATYSFVHASFSDYQGYLLIGFLGVCGIAGIGSVEAVFVLLFRRLLPEAKALSTVVLYRFDTMLLPCVIGAFFVAGEKIASLRSKKSPSPTTPM